jgi:hypothetical protein
MTGTHRISSILALAVLVTVSALGQDRYQWRTAADVKEGGHGTIVGTVVDSDEGRNELELQVADGSGGNVRVTTDSLSTQYNGFGGTINGKPEIYTGSPGFGNIRVGDRLEVRGIGGSNSIISADSIRLIGRDVPASQVGVGGTRSPGSVSTPTAGPSVSTTASRYGALEGTVRQINATDGRIVIETDRREIMNVRTYNTTPVAYQGQSYNMSSLEVGDRIRVDPDPSSSSSEIRARGIEVTESVQDSGTTPMVAQITGKVVSVDRPKDVARIDTGRGQLRVDLSTATDSTGRRVRASDMNNGDQVTMSGRYGATSDLFIASSVSFNDEQVSRPPATGGMRTGPPATYGNANAEFPIVTIYATVRETLDNSPQLLIRDTQNTSRSIRLNVTDDFVVRTRAGTYTTADHLKANDAIVVKAYRDPDGIYFAQTIRMR